MADVSKIDIDGEQWDIKDETARNLIENINNKVNLMSEYTTTEKEIGTWVDGKKLYRLVITGHTNNRVFRRDLASFNIETLIKINGTVNASNQYYLPIPYRFIEDSTHLDTYYTYVLYDIVNKYLDLRMGLASYFASTDIYLVLEYTKAN